MTTTSARLDAASDRHRARRLAVGLVVALVAGCASGPLPPATGTASLAGTLRLVPHEGVTLPSGAGAYADRALRDAELVDYSKPGFAVVSVAGLESPRGTTRVELRATRFASRFEPRHAAVGVGGSLVIRNGDDRPRALSCPGAGVLTSVASGAELTVPAAKVGELRCFALGGASDGGAREPAEVTLYVAPGPYAIVGSGGGFELDGLRPPADGSTGAIAAPTLVVWHPRFPPLERPVSLAPGSSERLDLELQVR